MVNFLSKYIAVFLTGFTVSYFLTPVVRWVAVRFGIVDLPNERRPHKQPTARGGGLAVFLGFHAACLGGGPGSVADVRLAARSISHGGNDLCFPPWCFCSSG